MEYFALIDQNEVQDHVVYWLRNMTIVYYIKWKKQVAEKNVAFIFKINKAKKH